MPLMQRLPPTKRLGRTYVHVSLGHCDGGALMQLRRGEKGIELSGVSGDGLRDVAGEQMEVSVFLEALRPQGEERAHGRPILPGPGGGDRRSFLAGYRLLVEDADTQHPKTPYEALVHHHRRP